MYHKVLESMYANLSYATSLVNANQSHFCTKLFGNNCIREATARLIELIRRSSSVIAT